MQYPDLELILCSSDNAEDIIQEGFDCVIRTGRIEDSTTLVARPLARYRWMVLASPGLGSRPRPAAEHRRSAPPPGGGLPEPPYRADHRLAFPSMTATRAIRMRETLVVDDTDAYIQAGIQGWA